MTFDVEGYTPSSSLRSTVDHRIPSADASRNDVTQTLQGIKHDYSRASKSDTIIIQTSFDGFEKSVKNHHPELALTFAEEYLTRAKHTYPIFDDTDKVIELNRMHMICVSIPQIKEDFNKKITQPLSTNIAAQHKDKATPENYPKFTAWERFKYSTYATLDNIGLNNGIKTKSEALFTQLKNEICEKPQEITTELLFDHVETINFGESKHSHEIIETYIKCLKDVTSLRIENKIHYKPEEKFAGVSVSNHYDLIEKWRKQIIRNVLPEPEERYVPFNGYVDFMNNSFQAQRKLESLTNAPAIA